jgi:hypothetical protein
MMIRRGENMEAEGQANIARGRTLRDQGDRTKGETLIAEGEAKRDAGRKMINKGKGASRLAPYHVAPAPSRRKNQIEF